MGSNLFDAAIYTHQSTIHFASMRTGTVLNKLQLYLVFNEEDINQNPVHTDVTALSSSKVSFGHIRLPF